MHSRRGPRPPSDPSLWPLPGHSAASASWAERAAIQLAVVGRPKPVFDGFGMMEGLRNDGRWNEVLEMMEDQVMSSHGKNTMAHRAFPASHLGETGRCSSSLLPAHCWQPVAG